MLLANLLANSKLKYKIFDGNGNSELKTLPSIEIETIFCDSRQVVRNGLYIAIDGLHTDSHKFIGDAAAHGARAAIVSESAMLEGRVQLDGERITLLSVEDCREAFAAIYAAWYSNPQDSLSFVGVTGTNGKTTVSRMIFEILSRSGYRCGLIGTAGNMISSPSEDNTGAVYKELDVRSTSPLANMTTPDPPELYKILSKMRNEGVKYVVMEVTSHALALKKVAPIEFEVGIFTNLSEDHLDFHQTMEEYYRAKKSLFAKCKTSLVNIDGKYGRRLASELETVRRTCSCEGRAADYSACDIRSYGELGVEYRLASGRMRLRLKSNIPGVITVMNTMQAAAACNLLGISARDIKDSIATIEGVKGRLEKLKFSARVGFSVYIDYAHTPDALENLLRTAKMFSKRGQRIVLLFGCGGDRERQKRATMGRIAATMADFFVVTTDNPRGESPSEIIDEIISGIGDEGHYTVIEDRERAIEYVIRNARQGDVILLAGKGHEEYQINGESRIDFSEREIAEKYVKRYYG